VLCIHQIVQQQEWTFHLPSMKMRARLHVQRKVGPENQDSRRLEPQTTCRPELPGRQRDTLLCPSMPEENSSSRHEELVHRGLCEELVFMQRKHGHELI
jgi:hypothetical protein